MPTNGAGTYTVPSGINPVVAGTIIQDTWANPTLTDVAQGITDRLDRNGRGAMLAQFKSIDGAVGGPGMSFGSELTSGWYRETTGTVSLALLGVKKLGMSAAVFAVVPPATFATGLSITGALALSGALTLGGLITSTAAEAFRIANSAGFLGGYDTANAVQTGYLQFNAASSVDLFATNGSVLRLGTAAVERVRIDVSGNVGIGGTPTAKLDVIGAADTYIRVTDTTVQMFMQARATGGAQGVVGTITNHPFSLWTNGAERVRINAAGEVGIGGTAGAGTKLDVIGAAATTAIAAIRAVAGQAAYLAVTGNGLAAGTTSFDMQQDGTGAADLNNRSNTRLSIYTNATERIRIAAGGDVGIGNVTNSDGKLAVSTTNRAIGSGTGQIYAFTTDSQAANLGGQMVFGGSYTGTTPTTFAAISGRKENSTNANIAGYMSLSTNDASLGMTERIRISSAGVVDIAAGSAKLTMAGGITRFESAEQTCPSGTTIADVAHGGARVPDLMQLVLRCKITEGGFAVGDEIDAQMDDGSRAMHLYSNATRIGFNYTGAGITPSIRNTSGTLISVTAANWRLVLRAHWL